MLKRCCLGALIGSLFRVPVLLLAHAPRSYLKLLMTALRKIKPTPGRIWRGVKSDHSKDYEEGKDVVWWPFTSCSTNEKVVKENVSLL